MNFKAKFNAHGFVPGVDISQRDWQNVICEFTAMYDQFANMSNQVIDRLNETWEKYESIKRMDNLMGGEMATFMTQKTMGIDEKTTYEDWMEKWYKDICEAVDACAIMAGFKLRSNLFRDDNVPLFGAKFKDRPEWTIDMSLEPVEE